MTGGESSVWKLIVWTRLRVDVDALVDLVVDPHETARCLPRWVRWDVSDPIGLSAARRDGASRRFATRMRSPLGTVDWPVEVVEGSSALRFTERSENAWFSLWLHRHRIERAIGGRARSVDEVVFRPNHRTATLAARAVERVIKAAHGKLVHRLEQDGHPCEDVITSSRLYRLELGNLEHAEAALGELPGAGQPAQ